MILVRITKIENGKMSYLNPGNKLKFIPRVGEYIALTENDVSMTYIVKEVGYSLDTGAVELFVAEGKKEAELFDALKSLA